MRMLDQRFVLTVTLFTHTGVCVSRIEHVLKFLYCARPHECKLGGWQLDQQG
jgi:hypothetical protein